MKNIKRISAVLLCLSMLCGLLTVGFAMPASADTGAAAEPEVVKFNYDFGEMESVSYTSTGQEAGEYAGFTVDGTDVTAGQPGDISFANTIDFYELMSEENLDADAYAAYRAELLQKFSEFTCRSNSVSGGNGVPEQTDFNFANSVKGGYTAFTGHAAGGYIMATNDNSYNSTAYFKSTATIVPKDVRGNLIKAKNFEVTFTVRANGVGGGFAARKYGVGLVFRQKTAGKVNDGAAWTLGKDQGIVILTPDGISAGAGTGLSAVTSNNTLTANYAYSGAARHDGSEHFTVTVRVVNNDLKMRVYSHGWVGANNSIQFDNFEGGKEEETVINLSNYDQEGYIGFVSLSGKNETCSGFGNISITKLDDEGNPIDITMPETFDFDFGETNAFGWEYTNQQNNEIQYTGLTNDETSVASVTRGDKTFGNAVSFKELAAAENLNTEAWNAYKANVLTKFSEFALQSTSAGGRTTNAPVQINLDWTQLTGEYTAFNAHTAGGYLSSFNENTGNPGAYFKSSSTLVPKDKNGNLIKSHNFEAEFTARLASPGGTGVQYHHPAVALTFRQKVAGKTTDADNSWKMGGDQGIVMLTHSGAYVGAGTADTDNVVTTNVTYAENGSNGSTLQNPDFLTVKVRVVGNDLKLRVVSHGWNNASQIVRFDNFAGGANASTPLTLNNYNEEGYIGLAVFNGAVTGVSGFGKVSITELNAAGNPVDVNACLAGHTVAAYTANNDATCTKLPTESGVCSVCGATDTRNVEGGTYADHVVDAYVPNDDATCEQNGTETGTCSVCEQPVTRDVANSALGHDWSEEWENNDTHHWHECANDDKCDITENANKDGYGEHSYTGDTDATCDCGYTRELKNGWVKEGGKWYIYENGVTVKNDWRKDSKGWVYLGADGAMVTNKWLKDSKGWCFVGDDGYCLTNTWKKDSTGWTYLGADCRTVVSDWVKDNGKWYYMNANGYMVTGWQKINNKWYYFESNGVMAANCWKKDSKGWVKLGDNGAMLVNKWTTDSKGWCYVGADGYAVTDTWKKDSKGWVWLDANGSQTKSKWVEDGGKWYYCDANGYMVASKTMTINGKKYTFNASGVCLNP